MSTRNHKMVDWVHEALTLEPSRSLSVREVYLSILRRRTDEVYDMIWQPQDFFGGVRVALSHLVNDGSVERTGHGCYRLLVPMPLAVAEPQPFVRSKLACSHLGHRPVDRILPL